MATFKTFWGFNSAAPAAGAYTLTAETGAVVLAGQAAVLRAARTLPASTGAITLAGVNAGLRAVRTMLAAPGAIVLTGNAATLIKAGVRVLPAGTGAIVLTGLPVNFILTTLPQHYVMYAATGAIRLSGTEVFLTSSAPYYPVSMASLMVHRYYRMF